MRRAMSLEPDSHAAQMKSKSGLARVFKAFGYSMKGLATAWRDEFAFRQELIVAGPALVVAAVLPVTLTQKALLVGSIFLVLVAELINSAVEAVVDLVTRDHHPMAGKAKDIGSACVLMAIVNAGVVWALVLADKFL